MIGIIVFIILIRYFITCYFKQQTRCEHNIIYKTTNIIMVQDTRI